MAEEPKPVEQKVETGKVIAEKEPEKKKEIILKADTMFRVDNDGNLIPEKIPIEIYDRGIDQELLEESELLAQMIKRNNSFDKIRDVSKKKHLVSVDKIKKSIELEKDEKKKEGLNVELKKLNDGFKDIERRNEVLLDEVNQQISECREIIKGLKESKEKMIKVRFVEAIPLTTSEAFLVFEKNQGVDGKDTSDPIASLIVHCIKIPKYTIEEAKKIRLDFKLAMKEAIMGLSNYSRKSYRDVILEGLRSPLKKPVS